MIITVKQLLLIYNLSSNAVVSKGNSQLCDIVITFYTHHSHTSLDPSM